MRWMIVLFVVVPLVELYLLVVIGAWLGLGATILLTLGTGIAGGMLAKSEGLRVWQSWQRALAELRPPDHGVAEGLLVLVGGVLLITPGILTDLAGLLCVVPMSRRRLAAWLVRRVESEHTFMTLHVAPPVGLHHDGETIETSGIEVEDDSSPSRDRCDD